MRTQRTVSEIIKSALRKGPVHAHDFPEAYRKAGGRMGDKWARADVYYRRDQMVKEGAILLSWDAEGWPIYRLAD